MHCDEHVAFTDSAGRASARVLVLEWSDKEVLRKVVIPQATLGSMTKETCMSGQVVAQNAKLARSYFYTTAIQSTRQPRQQPF